MKATNLFETVTVVGAALPRSISISSSLESVSSRLAGCGRWMSAHVLLSLFQTLQEGDYVEHNLYIPVSQR